MKKTMQPILNIVKNHPIKILASGTGGITILFGMSKIMFTLKYTDIIQILSNLKNIFIDNISIIMLCICVMIISTYVLIYEIKKLKSNRIANQDILKGAEDILNKNANISGIEIHSNSEELSISINTQSKEENSRSPINLYAISGKKETNDNKEIEAN